MACLTKHQLDYIACETAKYLSCPDEEDITLSEERKLKFKDRHADDGDGMGYVILRKNKTFAEQVAYENTIYEIRYDFDLGGSSVTMPSGCVLKFNGGSINNGTLNGQGTKIEAADVKLFWDDIAFSGTWIGRFNLAWLGLVANDNTFDNGIVINALPNVFGFAYIPRGVYYFTTPIVFSKYVTNLICDGDLYYNGNSSELSLVTLQEHIKTTIRFNGIIKNVGPAFSLVSPITSVIGLDVKDCNNTILYVDQIWNANECLRLMSTGTAAGGGCAYNTIYPNLLCNCNTGIRLNSSGHGWVNQNNFFGGRIVCQYGNVAPDNMRRIVVDTYGVNSGNVLYSPDALTVIGMSLEGSGVGIDAKNLQYSSFIDCRFEGLDYAFVGHGQCDQNDVVPTFGGRRVNLDDCHNAGLRDWSLTPYASFTLSDGESITLDRRSGSSSLMTLYFSVAELDADTCCKLVYTYDTDGNAIPASSMDNNNFPLRWNHLPGTYYYKTGGLRSRTPAVTVPSNIRTFTLTADGGSVAINVFI